jgi:glycosyltransferase 2 family protein
MTEPKIQPHKPRSIPWKMIINIVTLVALAALIYTVREEIADTLQNLKNLEPWALLLILPAQILNYHSYAELYQSLFKLLGHNLRYKKLFILTLELNFVNNVFPSGGVTGISYFGVRMKTMGVSPGKSTLVQMIRYILLFVSFQILLFLGLIILAIGGQASNFAILIAGSLATLLFVGTLAAMFIVGSKKRINGFFTYITRFVNRLIRVVRPKHPETINIQKVQILFTELHENYLELRKRPKVLRGPLLHALMANIAEILTIYVVYIAFGQWVNPGAVIIAYAIANFAGLISVLPGGVGVYEALMTAVLASSGVPAGVSIPITITYRILNMTLQLPPGYYFYHRALRQQPSES